MAEGEIRVQARLVTDKLAGDLSSAKTQIQQQINTASGAFDATRENVKRRLALEELRGHRAAGLRGYNVQEFFGQRGKFAPPVAPYTGPKPPIIGPLTFPGQRGKFAPPVAPYTGPKPPIIGPLTSVKTSPAGLAVVGVMASLAALRVAVLLVTYAFRMMTAPMRAFFNWMQQMGEAAKKHYATSLSSGGMPLGFTVHRSQMAKALGVGENEVLQYGAAVSVLNEKFAASSRTMAEATPALTAMNWEFQAAAAQISAVKMAVAAEFAPAMQRMAFLIRKTAQMMDPLAKYFAESIKAAVTNGFRMALGGGFLVDIIKQSLKLIPAKAAPTEQAWSRRLDSSPWERMGLVMGGRSMDSPERQTAKNTQTIADIANRILNTIAGAFGLGGATSEVLPRGNHGMHADFTRGLSVQSP